jgi:FlaA1/EpsC-like NDP-sugar epimerase
MNSKTKQPARFGIGSSSPRVLIWLVQLFIFAISGAFAFLLRFEFDLNRFSLAQLGWAVAVWLIVKAAAFRLMHLDRGWWRYTSIPDFPRKAGTFFTSRLMMSFIGIAVSRMRSISSRVRSFMPNKSLCSSFTCLPPSAAK